MADDQEKTEEPTSKKIEDSKKEGNVPKSAEVSGAAVLFFSSLYLLFFSDNLFLEMKNSILYSYSFIGEPIDGKDIFKIVLTLSTQMLIAMFPLFIIVLFMALIFNLMQFGFVAAPLKIDLQKIDPISGFKNVFSFKKAIEAFKLFAKLTVIFFVMVVLLMVFWNDIIAMMSMDVGESLKTMILLTIYFLLTILLIIVIFAIIDFFFTRYYYFKQLRMSKQEIKDEHKNMEGDPQVKGRIRSIQMKMARQRMMSNVSEADVVITNPEHYAVALQYDDKNSSAPIVVAKGIDFIALKIKDIAKMSSVPIIEDPALARALYEQVALDREIPEVFYKAIAEIFTYIYKLKGKK
ncbi:MAG: flagellar biosynthesis protein FlhB [Campylobacterales bacterium]|nr:flagellar biosynthesis protein FlhB [Campylobacterales bacterium]